jgi:tRNA uridine 5-carboxymethylaminomethyl modification enzyme
MRTDLLIIGAGHAGCEAALAAARLGVNVVLAAFALDAVAQMSCNPAVGGLAKGQLVREIDALGGAMGLAIDVTGIQFKMLNASKGASVRSPRAQADKWAYQHWMKAFVEKTPRVQLLQSEIAEIVVEGNRVVGAKTALREEIRCRAVIVATGTFLSAKTHVGTNIDFGGRFGERAANRLDESLRKIGLPMRTLKTGTCPRLDAKTVDFSALRREDGDAPPAPFSFLTEKLDVEQAPCWSAWTTEKSHQIIADILPATPLFSGQIVGVGPRYCPSFELKVARFPDKKSHHLFIEPEGRDSGELYVNGLSTSVDPEAQIELVRSIPGLENAAITRFGYAVEYSAVEPRALRDTLETKDIAGLFLAGQINGTSGYEEAAAQGLVAGANAAGKILGKPPFRLRREEAYVGVLIDDIVTRGADEPYRLFTSRAENRLALRHDNADLRLTAAAREYGLIAASRADRVEALRAEIGELQNELKRHGNAKTTAGQMLKNPQATWDDVLAMAPEIFGKFGARAIEEARLAARYEGYLARQNAQWEQIRRHAETRIPIGFSYADLVGLRNEAREKFAKIRPETLAQAMRIEGVSPADAAILALGLKAAGR